MADDKKVLIEYGQLNPVSKPNVSRKRSIRSFLNTDFVGSIRESAHNNLYGIDSLKNTGPYQAICLTQAIEGGDANSPRSAWYQAASDVYDQAVLGFAIRARIPEIHSYLPDPFAETDLLKRQQLIDMHPLFVSNATTEERTPPNLGDLVLVDFQDKNNFRGGMYLDKIGPGYGQNPGVPLQPNAGEYGQKFSIDGNTGLSQPPLVVQGPLGDIINQQPQPGNTFGNLSRSQQKDIATSLANAKSISNLGGTTNFPVGKMKCNKGYKTVENAVNAGVVTASQVFFLRQTAQFLEVIRSFWRRVFSDAELKFESVLRLNEKGTISAHSYGLATDIRIETKFANRWPGAKHNILPVHIVYSGYRYMIEKELIPAGAIGIYLNVVGWNESNPFTTRVSAFGGRPDLAGLAGSSNIHYDWRGSDKYGSTAIPIAKLKKKRNKPSELARWVYLDIDGDGGDEIKMYTASESRKYDLDKRYPSIYNLVWGDGWKKYARSIGLTDV